MPSLTTSIQYCTRNLARAIRQKEIIGIPIAKKEIKLSLFAHGTYKIQEIYKKIELISKIREAERYKIKIQKSILAMNTWTLKLKKK